MDQWVSRLVDQGRPYWSAKWPKASRYELDHDPKRGPILRGHGRTTMIDLTKLDPNRELAAARGKDRLLATVNKIGLTTAWVDAKDGLKWSEVRRLRPATEMSLSDFERDLREVRQALEAFRVGLSDVWEGTRIPQDPSARAAQSDFMQIAHRLADIAHTELIFWAPTVVTLRRRGGVQLFGGYGLKKPPSLKLFCLAQIVGAAQDREPVRECEQCHDLFLRPEQRQGAKGKYVRRDVRFCSQSCAQKAWYERKKRGASR